MWTCGNGCACVCLRLKGCVRSTRATVVLTWPLARHAADIPKYDIRLDLIRMDDNASTVAGSAAGGTATAVLRGADFPVTTSYGVATWDDLEAYGWPGRHVLRARAEVSLDAVGPRAYPVRGVAGRGIVWQPCRGKGELGRGTVVWHGGWHSNLHAWPRLGAL